MKVIKISSLIVVWSVFSLLIAVNTTSPAEKTKELDIKRAREHESRYRNGDWGIKELNHRLKNALPTDTDNDGMPDAWEDDHGLDKNDPGDAWFDPDGDKVINLFEYQLDSVPSNPNTPPFVTVSSASALETALDSVADGTNIKVAGGTYYINYVTFNEKIIMIQGGWKSDFSQRNLSKYPTTLDGNMQDEILYFSCDSGQPVIITDGLNFVRGAGYFGALNLLAKDTASMKTSILDCSFTESTSGSTGGVLRMNNWDSSESDRTIANTLIANNLSSGIKSQNTEGSQSRWRIINATITDNKNGGGYNGYGIEAFTLSTGVLDIQIFNSIIWGNEEEDINIRRNITCNSDYSDIGNVNADYGAVHNSGPHNKNANPHFIGGGDYHLNPGSDCIDTGTNTGAPVDDLDGIARPNPDTGLTDIGCYEYYAPATPTPAPIERDTWSGDYNGDGTSDIAIFRSSSGLWSVRGMTRVYFGSSSDIPVPGDYNGNNTTDIGIYRSSSGLWAIKGVTRSYFGSSSDTAVPGDYNGDGYCDMGIFRGNRGLWAIKGVTRTYLGGSSDSPVPGDYNGDSTQDIGIFRGSSGLWAIRNITRIYFGSLADTIVPGDYDGDGTWEPGLFREDSGRWAIKGVTRCYFGSAGDGPVPADYDGDSRDDFGIFRGSLGLWAVRGISRVYFGSSGDVPVTR